MKPKFERIYPEPWNLERLPEVLQRLPRTMTPDQRTAWGQLYLAVVDYDASVPGAYERFQYWNDEVARLERYSR